MKGAYILGPYTKILTRAGLASVQAKFQRRVFWGRVKALGILI